MSEHDPRNPSYHRSFMLRILPFVILGLGLILFLVGLTRRYGTRVITWPIPENLNALDPTLSALIQQRLNEVQSDPDNPETHGQLGIVYEAHSYHKLAMQCYEQSWGIDSSIPRWRYHWAVLADQTGNSSGAANAFLDVLRMQPYYLPALERLGLLLLEQNDYDGAQMYFTRIIETRPNISQGYIRAAQVDLALREHAAARNRLQKALMISPNNHEAHYLLGQAYRGLGLREDAKLELARGGNTERVLLPDPWRSVISQSRVTLTAMYERAIKLRSKGKHELAVPLLEKVLQRNPDHIESMNALALSYSSLNRFDEAKRLLHRALEIRPDHYKTHLNFALAEDAEGHLPAALTHISEAIRLAPTMARPHLIKAKILSRMRRYDEALSAFHRVVEYDPSNPDTYVGIAEMLIMLGRRQDAIHAYQEAIARKPHSVQANYNLGILYTQTGQIDDAIRVLRTAVKLDPNNPRASQALKDMEKRKNP